MHECVFLCRFFFLLACLTVLSGCGFELLSRPKVLAENLYYDNGQISSFEDLRSEWIDTGEEESWRFYYALSYERSLDKKEEMAHIYLYFLIQNKEKKDSPACFSLTDPSHGLSLTFVRLNSYEQLKLPFIGLQELKDDSPENRFITSPLLKLKSAPFSGNVYVLTPLALHKPLDWSTLRIIYEQASNNQPFVFTWLKEKDSPQEKKELDESSKKSFPLYLKANGFQNFMSLVKKWGM